MENECRVATVVDSVTGGVVVVEVSQLLRRQTLHPLLVSHVDAKRPTTRKVMVDDLQK